MHLSALAASSLLAGVAYAYGAPGACSGACNIHDPALIRRESDGKYFRFSTGNRISYASAPAIGGPWTVLGSILPDGSSINLPGNDDLWAPDVQYVDGTYYAYYSVSTFGSQNSAIGVATSPSMDPGTWTDRGSTGIRSDTSKNYNAIDGNLFYDTASSTYLMSFGSFWGNLYQAPMKNPPTSVAGASYNVAFEPEGAHAVEAAYLYKYGSWYYLFYSEGSCCGYDANMPAAGEEYKIKACRSSSPTGGFVDANGVSCTAGGGTVVLESHDNVYGPGGQGIFTDPTLGPVLYYHYVDTNIGYGDGQKLFGWNVIDFSSGWPVV
ncbi:putative arabinan endo-1,5-alpha-L-arabinosidase A [Aspergillus pseudodeflectus]|uniref:Arabinan endo-1,5-alpha-L-arabinosidase n=1 Tax=Aspergillus pseudodeflectus TaxID=176178 RepID=A0ABR4KJV1_9EURO